jgi:hypothetical protein
MNEISQPGDGPRDKEGEASVLPPDDVIIERARPDQEMVVPDNRADGITFPSAS